MEKYNIRLRAKDIDLIKNAFLLFFSSDDQLWIFGSRVDSEKRGGDIDLYVEVNSLNHTDILTRERKFWNTLQDVLGEQKIDIVVNYGQNKLLIYDVAKREGIRLI